MSLIFEKSVDGRRGVTLPRLDTPAYNLNTKYLRSTDAALPEISELDLVRHYTNLSLQAKGVDNCFYPLGSCTMKYNPKLNEDIAKLKGFTAVHPLQPSDTVSGIVELMGKLGEDLAEITGMDKISLQPAAGAHGEYTSLQLIRKYHLSRGDAKRNKIIVPDSAHGTNPASASMVGFEIINIASDKKGNVDLKALKEAVGDD
ncbi:MAG: aminomethyl-transferring glycine dehydrogenase subunit GcvPB, partial [Clostridia bacterium]